MGDRFVNVGLSGDSIIWISIWFEFDGVPCKEICHVNGWGWLATKIGLQKESVSNQIFDNVNICKFSEIAVYR